MSRGSVSLMALLAILAMPAASIEKGPKGKEPFALIFGTVYSADSRPIQGVKIKFRRSDRRKPGWERASDRRGEFALRVFPGPAEYVIWPDLRDKQAAEKSAVKVRIEKDERKDVTLHLKEQNN